MITFQDFQEIETDHDKEKFIITAIAEYTQSEEYKFMNLAEKYFYSENISILQREQFTIKTLDKNFTINKQVATSNFFFRLVTQQNQFLLANGLQLDDEKEKNKLGIGFDTTLQEAGELALVHGLSWLFYNNDHVEIIKATNFIPLYDEFSGEPLAGINFWQLDEDRPTYIRLFEMDGISWYKIEKKINRSTQRKETTIELYKAKQAYKKIVQNDIVLGDENYKMFPVVPFKANERAESELKVSVKTKIDMYDLVLSDFGDNLQKTNSIYWILENFGGDSMKAMELRHEIETYQMIFTKDEEQTVKGEFMQVPHEARSIMLDLLESGIYRDFMGINLKEITGGSLTNVAIDTAKFNLVNKVNRYEYRVFETVQKLLKLAGIKTENIRFKREFIANKLETMQMLYMCRADIDHLTALEKNPLIENDEIEAILLRFDDEIYDSGGAGVEDEPTTSD